MLWGHSGASSLAYSLGSSSGAGPFAPPSCFLVATWPNIGNVKHDKYPIHGISVAKSGIKQHSVLKVNKANKW